MLHALAFVALLAPQTPAVYPASDTIRLEVGSKEVNGRIYAPHAARVRVYVGEGEGSLTAEWTNELTHGDSAGRPIHRWVTKGSQYPQGGGPGTRWELRQTYDAVTLAPYAYEMRSSSGTLTRLSIDGRRVQGTRQTALDAPVQNIDYELDRPGFVASASDLVPLAAGLRQGAVMIAPVWSPAMTKAELRIFSVLGKTDVNVEGSTVNAWKVEERRHTDRALLATWYLVEEIPYMVYGEVPLPDGRVRRMTEVPIPPSSGTRH